ncbi:hypothetical protein ACERIT_00275 [Halopenitus sp. H-Gu1]|uniref:DUF7475 family protein n=1 Tax=Halopenitus sp. H-Gu1 TaxID=3242697 RepID=UPI00359DC83A
MATRLTTDGGDRSTFRTPSSPVAYLAVLTALVSAAIHLFLAPQVIEFSRTTGILFYLNGAGFLGGIVLFFTRYWRRELYLVAVVYAGATIVAFFAMGGQVNPVSITSKIAEAILVLSAGYLYRAK